MKLQYLTYVYNIANMMHFIVVLLMVVAVVMAAKKDAGPVTCGSVIKMNHKATVRMVL